MKRFNTTAVCIPSKHYMVDISERVKEIKALVDTGEYFTINRARQYGKTTTLTALRELLSSDYYILSLDFQRIGNSAFENETSFTQAMARIIADLKEFKNVPIPDEVISALKTISESDSKAVKMDDLFRVFMRWTGKSERPIVMIIDEVDSATNNQVFLDFLAQLRDGYISRETDGIPAFQSVILAGVTDVKHLRSKIRDESEQKVNSPWNIAADFNIDMSLSQLGIKGMLDDYEADHHTGMDTDDIAEYIRDYTNGYPYLVSRICQLIDTRMVPDRFDELKKAWTEYGVDEAVKLILSETNTLFDSIMGKLINYPELNRELRALLMKGETIAFVPDDEEQTVLRMYGFIRNEHNRIIIDNRIFEMRLYAYYIGTNNKYGELRQKGFETGSIFVDEDGWLDIPKIMDHFIKEHNRIHEGNDDKFLEQEGRERFITYISAIINGTGTYSVEEQTRNHKRTDLVIHYLGRKYIIELKIWHDDRYNSDGEKQIIGYLEHFGLTTGYMLSFNFNKKKEPGVKRVQIGDRVLFEGVV